MTSRVHILWESRMSIHNVLYAEEKQLKVSRRNQYSRLLQQRLAKTSTIVRQITAIDGVLSRIRKATLPSLIPVLTVQQIYCIVSVIGLKFKEVLRLGHSSVWCWKLGTSEGRSGILASFETRCWRRKEISWTDRVRNEVVLHRVKEDRNILHTVKRRKANWIGHSCVGTAF